MEQKQEQALIRAAQKGDRNAVGALYDAYADNIYRYLFYRVNDEPTAEDLTAEVFLNFVEALSGYKIGESPLLAWLYRVAHARLVDYYRRQHRVGQDSSLDEVVLPTEDDADGLLMNDYHQQKVRAALERLTGEQRQVIVFRFIEGYNLQETADLMGKTTGAIKVMQYRALQSLNRFLSDQGVTYD